MSNIRNSETERTYHLISTTLGDGVSSFSESMQHAAIDLETRSDEALLADCRYHADEAVREQALYSLVRRQGIKALPALETALLNDANEQLRINALWLLEGMQSAKAAELGTAMLCDPSPRVKEWARVFAWEKGWVNQDFRVKREAVHYKDRTFFKKPFFFLLPHSLFFFSRVSEIVGTR